MAILCDREVVEPWIIEGSQNFTQIQESFGNNKKNLSPQCALI